MRYNFKLLLRSLWPNAINMLSECYRNATRMNLYAINEISMGYRYANYQPTIKIRLSYYQNAIKVTFRYRLPIRYECPAGVL